MIESLEQLAAFARKKALVYPHAEIYGGFSGFYDLGPLGVEIVNKIKQSWWKHFVTNRPNVVGIDGSVITAQKIWEASGHLKNFTDPLVEDVKTKKKYRADQLLEEQLNVSMDGKSEDELKELIKTIKSPEGNDLEMTKPFNLMFPVEVGAESGTVGYLRGETAQSIFTNFRNVTQTSRVQLPFGIAQMGKAFRNEISPRDFLFRVREFEQMELEFFFDPEEEFALPETHAQTEVLVYKATHQENNEEANYQTFGQLVDENLLLPVHAFWLCETLWWFESVGIHKDNLRLREHTTSELSHYSTATFDFDYNFPHIGFKELFGCANRSNYDLQQHQEHSKVKLEMHDDRTNKKVLPHVVEPSFGLGRTFLAILCDAYSEDKEREQTILHLAYKIAPYDVAILPLTKKLSEKAMEINNELKESFAVFYDESGSVGRRYARQDEIGTPFCITVDFDTLEDNKVTIRNRDTTEQIRIKVEDIETTLRKAIKGQSYKNMQEH